MASVPIAGDNAVNEELQLLENRLLLWQSHYGQFICMVQYADKSLNIGNLHPLQPGKLIYKRIDGVVSIRPSGAFRVEITFSSAATANAFLDSSILNH